MTRKPETFFEEMKRYVGFSEEDAGFLQAVGDRMDPHLPGMSERFYDQITEHPEAGKVFTGGQEQIDRLKRTCRFMPSACSAGLSMRIMPQSDIKSAYAMC